MNFRRPRGNVSTRLVVDIDANTDAGRAKGFRNGADECLWGAQKLNDGFASLTPEYILTFRALDLALKAFLAKSGLTNAELRKKPYCHNLNNLFAEACKRGLEVSTPTRKR